MTRKLLKARAKADISRRELSEWSGVPPRTLENWEVNGTYGARAGVLMKVAEVLRCPIEDLIDTER